MLFVLTAMAMAMDDSVTVSMGDEIRGVFRVIFFVSAEVRSCKSGMDVKTNVNLGLSMTLLACKISNELHSAAFL